MTRLFLTGAIVAIVAAAPAAAKEEAQAVTIGKCSQSYGAVAVVDGETQGWTKYGLDSPRDLIMAIAADSGCFTAADPANGKPATFLLRVSAGDKEEVNKTVSMVGGAAKEGLARSGLMGGLGGKALGGLMGGLGGKKKIIASLIEVVKPESGQVLLSGLGDVQKSTISIEGLGTVFGSGGKGSSYGASGDGKLLTEAMIKAFNAVSAQNTALAALMPPPPPPPPPPVVETPKAAPAAAAPVKAVAKPKVAPRKKKG